jgi:hypothetical protein
MRREAARREAAEHGGNLDHDRASEAAHQPIEQIMQRHAGRCGEMGVDSGGGMAGQDRHDADVNTVLNQSARIRMAQRLRRHIAPDAGCNDRGREGI